MDTTEDTKMQLFFPCLARPQYLILTIFDNSDKSYT